MPPAPQRYVAPPDPATLLIIQANESVLMTRDQVRATHSVPPASLQPVSAPEAPTIYDVMSVGRQNIVRSWLSGGRNAPTQQPVEANLPITSGGFRNAMTSAPGY